MGNGVDNGLGEEVCGTDLTRIDARKRVTSLEFSLGESLMSSIVTSTEVAELIWTATTKIPAGIS